MKKKINLIVKSAIRNTLYKYNPNANFYNVKKIDELMFNNRSRFVAVFKDYLVLNDDVEFLHRYYVKERIKHKLFKLVNFYISNSKIFPNYTAIGCSKYLYKNLEKKQAVIDEIYRNKKKLKMKDNQYKENEQQIIFDKTAVNNIDNESVSFYKKNLNKIIDISQTDEDKSIENIENIISIIEKEEEKLEKTKALFRNKFAFPKKNIDIFSLKKKFLENKIKNETKDFENDNKIKEIKQMLLSNKKAKYHLYEKSTFLKINHGNSTTYYKNNSHLSSGSISKQQIEQSPRLQIDCKDLTLSKHELKNRILSIEKTKNSSIPLISMEKSRTYGYGTSSLSPSDNKSSIKNKEKATFIFSEKKLFSPKKTHVTSFFKIQDYMKKNNNHENEPLVQSNKIKKVNAKINIDSYNENVKSMNSGEAISNNNSPLSFRGKTGTDFFKLNPSNKANEITHFSILHSTKKKRRFIKNYK